jgi:hypothetical protein
MMMDHEGQSAYSPRGIYGLRNQVAFLRKAGAATIQILGLNRTSVRPAKTKAEQFENCDRT